MRFPREHDHGGWAFQILERAKELHAASIGGAAGISKRARKVRLVLNMVGDAPAAYEVLLDE